MACPGLLGMWRKGRRVSEALSSLPPIPRICFLVKGCHLVKTPRTHPPQAGAILLFHLLCGHPQSSCSSAGGENGGPGSLRRCIYFLAAPALFPKAGCSGKTITFEV